MLIEVEVSDADVPAALAVRGTDENGLPESEVEERLAKFGKNSVASERPPTWYAMLLRNFRKFTVQPKSAPPATCPLLA